MKENEKFAGDNLSMLTDFYETTMGNGYHVNGLANQVVVFDMFFREIPDDGGFAIMAGLEPLIEYLQTLRFDSDDIEFLRSKKIFSEEFLKYLSDFKFSCDVWAVPEGTPIFPGEPIITVKGPIIQAQWIETMVLLTINHQCLIATKANRIVRAAQGRFVLEFGSRRAHGYAAAILGARAAYIGGCDSTACTIVDQKFGIPSIGTMAHSWIQLFSSELEAFQAYARTYPNSCSLLVDTYNVLKSGIPNAIKVFNEEIIPRGFRPKGIRIDSGDLTYLSKEARKMLDTSNFKDVKIIASNSLDENIIQEMLLQGAQIDIFGVGENLITSKSSPVFGGVYKLVAVEESEGFSHRIKLSENSTKITNPGFKEIFRFFDKGSGKMIADVIVLKGELIDEEKPYVLFDLENTCEKKIVTNFSAKKLQEQIFIGGTLVYNSPSIHEIRRYCSLQVESLLDDVKFFDNPNKYLVGLSKTLWHIKHKLLNKHSI